MKNLYLLKLGLHERINIKPLVLKFAKACNYSFEEASLLTVKVLTSFELQNGTGNE